MTARTKYHGVTGVKGLAVIPYWYTDADIDAVLSGAKRPFTIEPKFVAKVTFRIRFTIASDGKTIVRKVIVGES